MESFRDLLAVPAEHTSCYSEEYSENVQGSTAGDLVSRRFREGVVLDLFSRQFSNVDRDEWIQLDLDVDPYAARMDSGERIPIVAFRSVVLTKTGFEDVYFDERLPDVGQR